VSTAAVTYKNSALHFTHELQFLVSYDSQNQNKLLPREALSAWFL